MSIFKDWATISVEAPTVLVQETGVSVAVVAATSVECAMCESDTAESSTWI